MNSEDRKKLTRLVELFHEDRNIGDLVKILKLVDKPIILYLNNSWKRLNEQDREDIKQDALTDISIGKIIMSIRQPESSWYYILKIVRNKAKRKIKKIERTKIAETENIEQETARYSAEFTTTSPEKHVEQKELRNHIYVLMAKLEEKKPELFQTFTKKYVDNKSHKEIALELNISVETSRKRLSRARMFLIHNFFNIKK